MNAIMCSAHQLAELINKTNGAFFNVTFVKRTTGEERTMTCRTGVHKYTNGVGLKYDRKQHDLIGVWVSNEGKSGADAYRSISIDGLVSAKINGELYVVS
jgi:hypothetical protein